MFCRIGSGKNIGIFKRKVRENRCDFEESQGNMSQKFRINPEIFLLLSLMRYFGPQTLFYAILNKGFLDHAHLTDGMQWQKKSKKHIFILMHFILRMCSVRVNAALASQTLEKDL